MILKKRGPLYTVLRYESNGFLFIILIVHKLQMNSKSFEWKAMDPSQGKLKGVVRRSWWMSMN